MTANTNVNIKRAILFPVVAVCLYLAGAADASAHRIDHRPGFTEIRYVHARDVPFPRWLSGNRDFRHWYSHSHYRFGRHVSWARWYDLYHADIRRRRYGRGAHCPYHRHYGSRRAR